MADHEEALSQFMAVTGIEEERARFYLESSAWQLEVALAGYYENDGDEGVVVQGPVEVSPASAQPQSKEADADESQESPTSSPKVKTRSKNVKSKFATVHTLDTSSDEEEGQAFYAGGSEHSGQQVLGPSKKKDFVTEMFKSVQEHGAEVVEPSSRARPGSSGSAFTGTGYKLGQTSNDTTVVMGAHSRREQSHAEITLKMWREGFSVDDGQLRAYTDPENRDFLESIRRGEIPTELTRQALGSEVHLNMEDHRHEEFVLVKSKIKAFSGAGHTLGSPAPAAIGATAEEDKAVNENEAKNKIHVDPAQPTTNLQIRLSDGSRLQGQFNHTHTVGDIRTYIVTARPQYVNRGFMLMTTFPSRELLDSESIAEAGLMNAAIMQRLT